jgi:hypothetical protein
VRGSLTPLGSDHAGWPRRPAWEPKAPAALRDRAVAAVRVIADRLRSPENVLASAAALRRQQRYPAPTRGFGPCEHAWLAHLFLCLAQCLDEPSWEEPARSYLDLAAHATRQVPLSRPGLFGGTGGLALVTASFARHDDRFGGTCDALTEDLARQVLAQRWQRPTPGVAVQDYDAISGASGIVGCLVSLDAPGPLAERAIRRLLDYLVWLTENDEPGAERWFVAPQHYHKDDFRQRYPEGYVDLGLAHGTPGPLAALSLAWQAGHRVEGHQEAIERLSGWISRQRVDGQWGVDWANAVPLQGRDRPGPADRPSAARTAWCYGTPGVAAALWLAGSALGDGRRCRLALEGLESALGRPAESRRVYSPTLCHGIGGLLAVTLRFAHRFPSQVAGRHITGLVSQILDACHPGLPLGVRDEEVPGNLVDDPTFLTGATGVALVLLAASTPIEPHWDRALLIA